MHDHIPSLLNCTLVEIAEGLDHGTFSSAQLVEAYLARIAEVNDEYHAVIEVNPEALEIAKAMDGERKLSGARG